MRRLLVPTISLSVLCGLLEFPDDESVPWAPARQQASASELASVAHCDASVLPEDIDLRLPFPADTQVEIIAAYGPDGGSSYHDGKFSDSTNNDHYALDLVPTDDTTTVSAPLDGIVMRAGWADDEWAGYGKMVVLRHEWSDGHVYFSLYAHLASVASGIEPGGQVEAGHPLGRLGRSCDGASPCDRISEAHLHWAIYRDARLGPYPGGGPRGGRAVCPEPLEGKRDLQPGQTLVSTLSTIAMDATRGRGGDTHTEHVQPRRGGR